MKILLTGSEGQLGYSIKKLAPRGVELLSLNKHQFDLSNTYKIKNNLNYPK